MSFATRMMLFTLLFNIAAGILNVALVDYYPKDKYPSGLPTGYTYDESRNLLNNSNISISAPGAETSNSWWIKFLDFISLGFFGWIKTILENSIFGIIGIFENIGIMAPAYKYYFYLVLTIIYTIGIIDLFTGKKLNQ